MIFSKIEMMLPKVLTEKNAISVQTFCKKPKKQYFLNLEPKLITDNKNFWKSVKPLFSDKVTVKERINLTENEEILSSDTNIADTLSDYFNNVVQKLNIPIENSMLNTDLCISPALAVVKKYKDHQSIIFINKKMIEKGQPKFNFHFFNLEGTLKWVALLRDEKSFSSFRYSC